MTRTILRTYHNRENPYVQLNKKPLFDTSISLKALGLWARLMSRKDDWRFHLDQVIAEAKEKDHAIKTAIKELIDHGYCVRVQPKQRAANGKILFAPYEYVFLEFKACAKEIEEITRRFAEELREEGKILPIGPIKESCTEGDFPLADNHIADSSASHIYISKKDSSKDGAAAAASPSCGEQHEPTEGSQTRQPTATESRQETNTVFEAQPAAASPPENPLFTRLIEHGITEPKAYRYLQDWCDDLDELQSRIEAAEQWAAHKADRCDMRRVVSKAIAEAWEPKQRDPGPLKTRPEAFPDWMVKATAWINGLKLPNLTARPGALYIPPTFDSLGNPIGGHSDTYTTTRGFRVALYRLQQHYKDNRLAEIPAELLAWPT